MNPRLESIESAANRMGVSRFFLYSAFSTRREPYLKIFCKIGRRLMVDVERLDRLIDDLLEKKGKE